MDGSLPTSLKHIISNAEYYGPSLFLLGEFSAAPLKFSGVLLTELHAQQFDGFLLTCASTGKVNERDNILLTTIVQLFWIMISFPAFSCPCLVDL